MFLKRLFSQQSREMQELKERVVKLKAQMPEAILSAHDHSSRHRNEVLSSVTCGCFYCGKTFAPTEVTEWTDDNQTAFCPKCGIDSVIGSASGFPLTKEFLDEMNRYWF